MRDQYGELVPSNLALLDYISPSTLYEKELEQVVNARWYTECDSPGSHHIWIALDDVTDTLGYFEPADDVPPCLDRIAEALKRYSPEDGFYHA